MRLSPGDRRVLAARAATIYERRDLLAGAPGTTIPATEPPALRAWFQAFAPGNPDVFLRRLTWDGFDLSTAARAVSMHDGWTDARQQAGLHWTFWIDRFLAEVPAVLADHHAGRFSGTEGDDLSPFPQLRAPAVRAGRRAVADELGRQALDHVNPAVFDTLERQLDREVGLFADLALYQQFRAADDASAAPDRRYRGFVETMLDGGFVRFLIDHATLARQLATVVASWVGATTELLVRLASDRQAIAEMFNGGVDVGRVVAATPALSDPHHGRRRVVALEFESGLRIVYKPRSMRIEQVFGDLLRWMNTALDAPVTVLAVLDRDTHGWVEFAAHEPMADHVETGRCFRRAGSLMCLTAVLGARDLHRDNLVMTRTGPVLVDLELLLQPVSAAASAPQGSESSGHGTPASMSCLSTGMLSLVDLTPDGEPQDAGGLRGARTGALPFPSRRWRNPGTDALHPVDEPTFAVSGSHQVLLDGEPQRPENWSADLLAGFTEAYRLLLDRRDDLLSVDGPLRAFAGCNLRVLPRPTNQYAMLAHLLATPPYQRDGVAGSCAIDVLHRPFGASTCRPDLWPVAVAERRAMFDLDIPYFSTRADGTDAFCDGRLVATGYFVRSGLAAALDRVSALSPADLATQTALLTRALGESVETTYRETTTTGDGGQATGDRLPASGDGFVAAAEWIARELRSRAERTTAGLVWNYRPAVGGPGWRDHHLYDGSLGAAVLFAALGAVTDDRRWTTTAHEVLGPIRAHASRYPPADLPGDEPIGGGNGLGSIVYGLTTLATFGVDDGNLAMAHELASAVSSRVAADRRLDVVDGSAGAILGLLALHDVSPDPSVLAAAQACGNHLLDRAIDTPAGLSWPQQDGTSLLGFAHGAAGCATALARLWAATGDVRYRTAARRAFRFVRRHYLDSPANWPIAGSGRVDRSGGTMTGWCHGAPGIVMAALSAADTRGPVVPAALARALDPALRVFARWQPAPSDHLCCGQLARAEALLVAGCRLGRPEMTDAARAIAARVVERARRRGHFRLSAAGTDYRVFDPGFFQGLSGIGYQLLRLARPSRVPSMATFEATQSTLRYCSPDGPAGTPATTARPARPLSAELTS